MVFITLNYIEHFLILASIISGCISISFFASLIGIPIGITRFVIGLKTCAVTVGIKKYKSIIKKKKKKYYKIIFLAKFKKNKKEVLIYKALINSVNGHYKFVSINNFLKEYNEMKEGIKHLKT